MKLVSACLCGLNCRYNGTSVLNEEVMEMVRRGEAIPVCPELLGGLGTPRKPCEGPIKGRVLSKSGKDFTAEFTRGAEEVLKLARAVGADEFIGKARSPSCGAGLIFDGTFSSTLVKGDGVTTKLLRENGLRVRSADKTG